MAKNSPYKILGLSENASVSEIKKAYRRLAQKYHPDRNTDPNSAETFKAISNAYKLLIDETFRSLVVPKSHNTYSDDCDDLNSFMDDDDKIFTTYTKTKKKLIEADIQLQISQLYSDVPLLVSIDNEIFEISKMCRHGQRITLFSKKKKCNIDAKITILEDARGYVLVGDDLYRSIDVPFENIIFGTDAFITLPDDSKIKINLGSIINSGKILKISNKGMKLSDDPTSKRSPLLIKVNIIFSKTLTTHFKACTINKLNIDPLQL